MSKIQKKYIFNQCLYTMIQNFVDLHKLKLWFSRRRLRLFVNFFRQSVHKMMSFLSHLQHSRPCSIGHIIQTLVFGSSLYLPIQHGRSCCLSTFLTIEAVLAVMLAILLIFCNTTALSPVAFFYIWKIYHRIGESIMKNSFLNASGYYTHRYKQGLNKGFVFLWR